jgi:GntR family transcriptional regulator
MTMQHTDLKKHGIPLYFQLEQIIKSQIMTGELLPGVQIPTEKALSEIYRVSTITTRQAILNLVKEGLLLRKQGKGTFVAEGTGHIRNIMTLSVKGDIKDVVPEGLSAQKVRVLDIERIPAPKRVAELLSVEDDRELFLIRRVRSDRGDVISYIKNYLPLHIGGRIKKKDLLRFSMLQILRDQLGLRVRKGLQYIMAVVADHDVASALSVNISSPVLYLETLIFTDAEKPVEFVQTFYRSDQYKYTLQLDLDEIKTA